MGGGSPYPNHADSVSRLSLGTQDESWSNTNLGGNPLSVLRDEISNGTLMSNDPSSTVFTFDVGVGHHFYFNQILEVCTRASVDAANANAGSVADSSNAAGFCLRSLTAGVTIESASGHSYAAPVPEPGSVLLQGSAPAALALALRRRTLRVRADA